MRDALKLRSTRIAAVGQGGNESAEHATGREIAAPKPYLE